MVGFGQIALAALVHSGAVSGIAAKSWLQARVSQFCLIQRLNRQTETKHYSMSEGAEPKVFAEVEHVMPSP